MGKKLKKEIARKVLAEAEAKYDFEQAIFVPKEELAFVDKLIDDGIINRIFFYDGYRPAMRKLFHSNLFRAELLKAIKYPEISYRKLCTAEYLGLPLHKKC